MCKQQLYPRVSVDTTWLKEQPGAAI